MKLAASVLCAATLAAIFSAPVIAGDDNSSDIGSAYILHTDLLAFKAVESGAANYAQGEQADIALGYVAGVSDTLGGVAFCIPGGVTRGQMMHVVLNYLDANPEQWQYGSPMMIGRALSKAFPCKKS